MSSTFGNVLHLSIFGQSHSPAIGWALVGISPRILHAPAFLPVSPLTKMRCRPF